MKLTIIAVLGLTAAGWRPRITAIPFWWILFSNQASLTTVDGGDQIGSALALLLIPISLSDTRRWHWRRRLTPATATHANGTAEAIAASGLFALRLQVAFVYLNACLSKLAVPEWLDGTACYYWLNDPMFGPSGFLRQIVTSLMSHPLPVAIVTWGTLGLEFSLGIALFLPSKVQRVLLGVGVSFHLGIAMTMGLWSFAFTMWAALLIYLGAELSAFGHPVQLVRKLSRKTNTSKVEEYHIDTKRSARVDSC